MARSLGLTAKQARFIDEYLIDLNATQACIRAGYAFPAAADGYYTYFLIDPRDQSIFYVGKGIRSRMQSHAKRAAAGIVDNAPKFARIEEIRESGLALVQVIFGCHADEHEAYSVERELIRSFKGPGLTNILGGVVTNAEAIRQTAINLLGRMKSFEEWIATARPEQIQAASVFRGSPRAAYDDTVSFWQRIIAQPV